MIDKLKTRALAGGSTQDRTLYSILKYPIVKVEYIFTCMALASDRKDLYWGKIDVGRAYLNVFLMGEVIIITLST